VKRDGQTVVFRDPHRDEGTIFYPLYEANVRVQEDGGAGSVEITGQK